MSWYVEQLILNGASIKSKSVSVEDDAHEFNSEEDAYLDILSIEMKVKELYNLGLLTEREFNILQWVYLGNSFNYIAKELKLTRETVVPIFKGICAKIAFSLGEHFTDEGYINYFSTKYSLQDDEIEKIKEIMFT